jgi:hypothetical protein
MLKTVKTSSNSKTGPIAVTYRAGSCSTYGTCPSTCGLHPAPEQGAPAIDTDYLQALLAAVPPEGQAWTYSHFSPELLPIAGPGQTVINASCDTPDQAVHAWGLGRPVTVTAPAAAVLNGPVVYRGVKFIQCPEQTGHVSSCMACGNGRPLCARKDRDYVIVFKAHGTGARKVATDKTGGCYAASGHVAIQWHATRKAPAVMTDGQQLLQFTQALPAGSLLRHHVAGDIGREK